MATKKPSHMLVRILGYFVSGLTILIASHGQANPFYGSISAVSGVSDNALKTEQDSISERQDQYSLDLGGKWSNSWLAFNMIYDATAQTFSEGSQPEKNYLNGNSSLLVGNESQPANLLFEHSRTTLLNAPDSVNLAQNQDERDIFSLKPTLRQRLSPVDNLLLNGEHTRINYIEDDLKDSERNGGSLVLLHKFSPLDDIQLSVQQTDIDFQNSPDTNYTYHSAAITYSVKLRKISYSARAGFNKTSTDIGNDYSSPSYGFNFAYEAHGQNFSVNATRELTDNSVGGGNTLPNVGLPTSDGSGPGIDQIERKVYGVSWSTFVVCQNCTFVIGIVQTSDDHLHLDQYEKDRTWNTSFNYVFTAASKISLQYADGNHDYTGTTLGRSYQIKSTRLEYGYQFNRDFGISCTLRKERRAGDQVYSESYAGAGINYKF